MINNLKMAIAHLRMAKKSQVLNSDFAHVKASFVLINVCLKWLNEVLTVFRAGDFANRSAVDKEIWEELWSIPPFWKSKVFERQRRYTFVVDGVQHFVVVKGAKYIEQHKDKAVLEDVYGVVHHVPNNWQHLEIE